VVGDEYVGAKSKTLTVMLIETIRLDEGQTAMVKRVIRNWLGEVGLPVYSTPESIRKLLITLVDEP